MVGDVGQRCHGFICSVYPVWHNYSIPFNPCRVSLSGYTHAKLKPNFSNSTVLFILVTAFLNLAGIGILAPILPDVVKHYVAPNKVDFWVAMLLLSYSFCQFIAVPTLGAMSDRYGRRIVLLVSLFGSAVG